MSAEPSRISRGVFGYRRSQVERLLADRDGMLRVAEGRVRAAEAHAAELDERSKELEAHVGELQQELSSLRERLAKRDSVPRESTAAFLTEELSTILSAAEESATRIIERARMSTQQQLVEADHMWREVQAEISRFAAWRENVDPTLRAVQSRIDDVRTKIDEVPERIRRALAPVADAIAAADGDLRALAESSSPPLLAAPSNVDRSKATTSEATEEAAPGHSASEVGSAAPTWTFPAEPVVPMPPPSSAADTPPDTPPASPPDRPEPPAPGAGGGHDEAAGGEG